MTKQWTFMRRRSDPNIYGLALYKNLLKPRSEHIEAHLELAWRKQCPIGFKFHVGNQDSENAFSGLVSFYWLAFFWSIYAPKLKRFAEWTGQGYKRNISLRYGEGIVLWEVWFCNDEFNTSHHCDKTRQPKFYPWRWGRQKYRSWMCLRSGSLNLNPLTAFWGPRYFEYVPIEHKDKILKMGWFLGDSYTLRMALTEVYAERKFGPKWARRRKFERWAVNWKAMGDFIPVASRGPIGVGTIPIDSSDNWWIKGLIALYKKVEATRQESNYRPPSLTEIPQKQADRKEDFVWPSD